MRFPKKYGMLPTMMNTQIIPTDPRERLAWALYQLKLRGLSLRRVAIDAGYHPQTLRGAFFLPTLPQERVIAGALDLAVEELFPERYDEEGNRIPHVREPKANAASAARHGKKTRAA